MQQERKTIEASALATDQGEFEAIAAAWTEDREHDVIQRGAFQNTIKAWRRSGKQLPLHWDHKGDPGSIIGHIDPQSMAETDEGLLVKGQLDLENSELAREAWRLVKANTVGLSFGYLAVGQTKRDGGGRDLTELDVFEISITPAPMNADTRILSAKGLEVTVTDEMLEDLDQMRAFIQGHREDWILEIATRAAQMVEGKAVWTAAYVNDLPDSCFLYIEPGGTKDEQGKTVPRSLRHFPVKDASGAVDMPHLRNALARIPQSDLPQSVKDACTAKAQRMMDAQKSLPDGGQEDKPQPVSPERRRIEQALLDLGTEGVSERKSPPVEEQPAAQAPSEDSLRELTRDQYLEILTRS